MARDLLKIDLKTVNNGYLLNVGKNRYMYLNLESLIEGFMLHIGLNEPMYFDNDFAKRFVKTAVAWKTEDNATTKRIVELTESNERLTSIIQSYKQNVRTLRERIEGYKKAINEINTEKACSQSAPEDANEEE